VKRRRARKRKGGAGRRAPPPLALLLLLALASLAAVNFAYQVVRKPTELLGLVAPASAKLPEATWAEYGELFEEHATELVEPELLAALVQVESAGDPLARTYWRWRWSWNPLELYAPASSAVGILQITDGTFVEASRLCVHDHAVAREGAWYDPSACWFNALYFRTVPSHAIEMTAALLHEAMADALAGRSATAAERHRLAALIHLCGRGRAPAYAQRGFRALRGERCGAHDLDGYVGRVEALGRAFARLPDPAP
jgi:hypothetical protein